MGGGKRKINRENTQPTQGGGLKLFSSPWRYFSIGHTPTARETVSDSVIETFKQSPQSCHITTQSSDQRPWGRFTAEECLVQA